jgi:acetyl esterase/lipase
MPELIVYFLIAVVAVLLILGFCLRSENLRIYDQTNPQNSQRFSSGDTPSAEHRRIAESLTGAFVKLKDIPRAQHLPYLRDYMDNMFADQQLEASFVPIDGAPVRGEWVLAPGAGSTTRTLYIHGGAFTMGSPQSHRTLTSKFSEITGGAVLAIDYRRMPEHPRAAGIDDCRAAYRWMLEHGPDGAEAADKVFVAGDSAGGNLGLSLIAWLRDQGLRAPDAVVALSPLTDSCFDSPSLKTNMPTDPMLAPLFAPLAKIPRPLLLLTSWMQNRIRPNHPTVSPVYGDLSKLPPVLVHASEVEMLVDDARRYVNKASAAGSPVRLQTWNHVVHVWQIFNPALTEAREAFAEIEKFLAAATARARNANR